MEGATDTLEFFKFKLKFDKESKQISVDVCYRYRQFYVCSPWYAFS